MPPDAAQQDYVEETRALEGLFGGEKVTIFYQLWHPKNTYRGTVFCLHGLTRQSHDFDFIAESLQNAGYAVISADAPGRGGSSRFENSANYGVDVYGEVFSAFLAQMKLENVHWIGTSMGGLIALYLSMLGRGAVMRTLTLVDITPKPSRAGLDRITGYISENVPTFTSPEQYEAALRVNLPLGDVPEEIWGHYARHQLRQTGPDAYKFHFDPLIARRALTDLKADVDLTAGLAMLTCPVALVAGGVSDLCTPVEIAALKGLKPNAEIHICPGAGHVPALADAPTKDFILSFLNRN